MAENDIPSWDEIIAKGINISTLPELPPGFRRISTNADARIVDGQLKVGHWGGHHFFCDEGPIVGGQDSAPAPLGYFAAAMGF